MLDTLTVMAYLVGHNGEKNNALSMAVYFPEKTAIISPKIRWKNIPPEANSLAMVIRDDKHHYYWVAYNLPVDSKGLPYGADQFMIRHDEGVNSFGERKYHSPWSLQSNPQKLTVELYALDRKLTAEKPLSGEALMAHIQHSTIAETQITMPNLTQTREE